MTRDEFEHHVGILKAWGSPTSTWAAAELEANAAEIERLREALEIAVRIADSWIHDQLDGTSMLDDALAELEPARAALNKQESGTV